MAKKRLKKNPRSKEIAKRFERLVDVMYTLRSDEGCPWDRVQTIHDLKQYLLEEAYEVLQALDEGNDMSLQEELGDLLFEIIFIVQMMQEHKVFTLVEVLDRLLNKMISRHAHVFGTARAESPDEAIATWESVKSQEMEQKSGRKRFLLEGVPVNLPALLQANLISSKVARVGFDWENEKDVWQKLEEELAEFREASAENKEEELGDILFTIVNIARKNKINPEDALRAANTKFMKRFHLLEERLRADKKDFKDLALEDLDKIWDQVKRNQ